MRKISMIMAAMALVLGLSQCKKDDTPKVIGEPVEITLDVKANNGAKIGVNTESGEVYFEQNDKVLVASGGKYVGTLTCRGDSFKGQITGATTGQKLKFYFLANKHIADTLLTPGTTTSCTIDISDQTSSKMSVISSATSEQNFTGEGSYNAYFYNQAALVMFNVYTSAASQYPTVIWGMNNTVTVSFANDDFTYSKSGKGEIMLPGGSGERWAILLPQDATTGTAAYARNGNYAGHCDAVPDINVNNYLFEGIDVTITTPKVVDLGTLGKWANWNIGANTPEEYGSYFAWGETEEKEKYDDTTYTYHPETYPATLPADHDVATVKWGADWRMPTRAEFQALLDNTTKTLTYQNGVFGCKFTASNGNSIFLPAAGRKSCFYIQGIPYYGLYHDGNGCYYWTSTYRDNFSQVSAYWFDAYTTSSSNVIEVNWSWADYGCSIRPVYIGS